MRWLFCVAVGLIAANSVYAQGVNLTEAPLADRCFRIELSMELTGKISAKQDGKDVAFPHKASARHAFLERCLEADGAIAAKVARHYTTAESAIAFDNNEPSKRSLRAERRFLVTQRVKEQIVTFSPRGALTREEMELTEHLDTMSIGGLLPGKSMEIGKNWSIPNNVVMALCELEGIVKHSLEGRLDSVKGDVAHIAVTGDANGINLGAQVEMSVSGQLEFDTKQQRIVSLTWKESDKRMQGPITPALTGEVTIKLTRTPIEEPAELNKF